MLDETGFTPGPSEHETLVKSVQRPHIVRVVGSPAQNTIEPEISTKHGFSFVDVTLLQQERSEGMPGRLHPSPRFVIWQIVIKLDGPTKVIERRSIIAPSIGDLAVQHR